MNTNSTVSNFVVVYTDKFNNTRNMLVKAESEKDAIVKCWMNHKHVSMPLSVHPSKHG
jgi:hypothetical protein